MSGSEGYRDSCVDVVGPKDTTTLSSMGGALNEQAYFPLQQAEMKAHTRCVRQLSGFSPGFHLHAQSKP